MSNLRETRKHLLNLTITEIILILLFLILLITAKLVKDNLSYKEIIKKNQIDIARMAELKKLEKAIEKLKEGNGEFVDMEVEQIVNELVLARERYKEIKDKDTEIAKLQEKMKDYEKIKKERAFYKKKYEVTGSDKPPCWIRKGTESSPEYLYDLEINDQGFVFKNTDSRYPHRIQERQALPVSMIVENITISKNDFINQTIEIKKYSDQKECRHYVLIKDKAGNSKEYWQDMLKLAESRFYKYLDTNKR